MEQQKLLLPLQEIVITTKTTITFTSNSYNKPNTHYLYTCLGYANNVFVIVVSTIIVVVYNSNL